MSLFLINYFLYVIVGLVFGLLIYKVFDKVVDFIAELIDLIGGK